MATPNKCLGTWEILLSEDKHLFSDSKIFKMEAKHREGTRKAKPDDSPPTFRITSTKTAPVTVGLKRASHVHTSTKGPVKLTLDKYPAFTFVASHNGPNFEISSLSSDELNVKVQADSGGVVSFASLPGAKFSVQIQKSDVVLEFKGSVKWEMKNLSSLDLAFEPYDHVTGSGRAKTLRPCKITFYADHAATVEVVQADAPPKSSQDEMPLSSGNWELLE